MEIAQNMKLPLRRPERDFAIRLVLRAAQVDIDTSYVRDGVTDTVETIARRLANLQPPLFSPTQLTKLQEIGITGIMRTDD
ncbi:MAG: hypothetical protein ABI602_03255 [Candidatus Saccharibacteria bacterium]